MGIYRKSFVRLLVVLLAGLTGVMGTLLLLSRGASARPMLNGASLSISKSQSADPVQVGASLVYTLTYQNIGTDTVSGVVVTDVLDPNVTYVTASITPDGGTAQNAPYWTIGILLSDSVSGTIVLTANVDGLLPNGTVLTNTASIGSDQTAPESDQITATVKAPTLELTKRGHTDSVPAGAPLTYTLAYTNSGDATATGVVITDVLDGNVTFVSASPTPSVEMGNTLTWTIGNLTPIAPGQIILRVTVTSPLTNDTMLTNTAWLDADWLGAGQTVPLSATQETKVKSRPVLTITKMDYPDPVDAGGILRYTLVITNSGNENASSVIVTEYYDPNVSFFDSDPDPDAGSGNREWTFPVLAVDDSESIDVIVEVTGTLSVGTALANQATLDSDQTTPITVTEITSVTTASELTVSKVDLSDPVEAGEPLM